MNQMVPCWWGREETIQEVGLVGLVFFYPFWGGREPARGVELLVGRPGLAIVRLAVLVHRWGGLDFVELCLRT